MQSFIITTATGGPAPKPFLSSPTIFLLPTPLSWNSSPAQPSSPTLLLLLTLALATPADSGIVGSEEDSDAPPRLHSVVRADPRPAPPFSWLGPRRWSLSRPPAAPRIVPTGSVGQTVRCHGTCAGRADSEAGRARRHRQARRADSEATAAGPTGRAADGAQSLCPPGPPGRLAGLGTGLAGPPGWKARPATRMEDSPPTRAVRRGSPQAWPRRAEAWTRAARLGMR
jgi:hypothetical protein